MQMVVLGDEILRAVTLFQIAGPDLQDSLRALWTILSKPIYKPFLLSFHEYKACENGNKVNADLKLRFDELNIAVGRLTSMIVELSDIPQARKQDVLRDLRDTLEGLSYAQALVVPVWNEAIVSSSLLKVLGCDEQASIHHSDYHGAGVR